MLMLHGLCSMPFGKRYPEDLSQPIYHKIADPVQSADKVFELSFLENFVDSRDFMHEMGIYIPSVQSILKTGCLFVFFTKIEKHA